jgi:predicted small lipoprotein YifL
VRVIRLSDRWLANLAVAAVLVAALSVAACGRKAGLDAPPSSNGVPQENGFLAPGFGPASDQSAAQNQSGPGAPPAKKSFILDPLLN